MMNDTTTTITMNEPSVPLKLRFANYVIDAIAMMVILFASTIVMALLGYNELVEQIFNFPDIVLTIILTVFYYGPLEGITGRTVGKFVTGTMVVTKDGKPIHSGHSFMRSICRIIPFEPFSMFRSCQQGWHDTLVNTKVVYVNPPQQEAHEQ